MNDYNGAADAVSSALETLEDGASYIEEKAEEATGYLVDGGSESLGAAALAGGLSLLSGISGTENVSAQEIYQKARTNTASEETLESMESDTVFKYKHETGEAGVEYKKKGEKNTSSAALMQEVADGVEVGAFAERYGGEGNEERDPVAEAKLNLQPSEDIKLGVGGSTEGTKYAGVVLNPNGKVGGHFKMIDREGQEPFLEGQGWAKYQPSEEGPECFFSLGRTGDDASTKYKGLVSAQKDDMSAYLMHIGAPESKADFSYDKAVFMKGARDLWEMTPTTGYYVMSDDDVIGPEAEDIENDPLRFVLKPLVQRIEGEGSLAATVSRKEIADSAKYDSEVAVGVDDNINIGAGASGSDEISDFKASANYSSETVGGLTLGLNKDLDEEGLDAFMVWSKEF